MRTDIRDNSFPTPPPKSSAIILAVFMAFWCTFVSGFSCVALYTLVRSARTSSYLPVPATITRSEVRSYRGKSQLHYAPDISYSYEVRARAYTSSTIQILGRSYNSDAEARAFLASYPRGAQATAYYDPRDPADAVLFPGLAAEAVLIPLFLAPFQAIAIHFLLVALGYAKIGPHARRPLAVQTWEEENRLRLRLNPTQPISTALIVYGAGFLPAIIALASALSVAAALSLAATIPALAILAYAIHKALITSGRYDMVLDRTALVLTLPPSVRGLPRDITYADIEAINMVNGTWKNKGGGYISWKVQIEVANQGLATIVQRFNYPGLKALTQSLRAEVGLDPQG